MGGDSEERARVEHDAAELASIRERSDELIDDDDERHPVCEFFHDPSSLEALEHVVFPKLLERASRGEAIRVWVPGCSTGEEVYSLAILLHEHLADSGVPIRLFGTDVNARAIAHARAGCYPRSIDRFVSAGRLRAYFTETRSAYQIRRSVRSMCIFAEHDVGYDAPFSGIDFVSCRNLSVERIRHERTVRHLRYALNDRGIILLDRSQTTGALPGFVVVDGKTELQARAAASRAPFSDLRSASVTEPRRPETGTQAHTYTETIVDSVQECLVVLDTDLCVRLANRPFYSTFNLSPARVLSRRFEDLGLCPPGDHELLRRLERLTERTPIIDYRVRCELAHLGQKSFVVNARRLHGTDLALVAFEDVTEREQLEDARRREAAEAARRRSELGFRAMLANANIAVLLIDAKGRIFFANRAASSMLGYSAAELDGMPIDALVPEDRRASHRDRRAAFAASPYARPMGAGLELSARRKDGSLVPVEIGLSPVEHDGQTMVAAFVSDVTERRATESAIKAYQEKLQQMAFDATVAEERERRRIAVDLHDSLGQSLALAQVKLSALRGAVEDSARKEIEEAIGILSESETAARTLTFDLSPPVLYDLGLEAALEWLADDTKSRLGLDIALDLDMHSPGVAIDETTAAILFRSVRELVTNVAKHARARSAKVTLRREPECIDLSIEDAGVGFDAASLERASRFGLFSVNEQITRLGGTVDVTTTPGHGVCVRLRVPLAGEGST